MFARVERTVTQKVQNRAEGEAHYGALLTLQGKIISDYIAHRTYNDVHIDVHEDAAEDLLKHLPLFRLCSQGNQPRDGYVVSLSRQELGGAASIDPALTVCYAGGRGMSARRTLA
jgi:folate-binding Fe-S cluster repair protein YgfZ